jgi:hypothetical protein
VNTAELELDVEPHSPGFIRQVVERNGLRRPSYDIDPEPWVLSVDDEVVELVDALTDPRRVDPIFVLTVAEGAAEPFVNATSLARATMGFARVVVVPDRLTWTLSKLLGKSYSVFGGASRTYMPDFSLDGDPYDHRLILGAALSTPDQQKRAQRWMRSLGAAWSLRGSKLGQDVLAFSSIRNASLRVRQEHLQSEGAGETEQLLLAQARIAALEADLQTAENYQVYFDEEAAKERTRAEAAEAQHRSAMYRIQQMEAALRAGGIEEVYQADPTSWSDFANWCDISLAGRLVLTPSARRGLKQAEFEDLAQAARCLAWLATTYRDGRMKGADGDFRDVYIEEGVRNSPCGGDEYEFDWQGRRYIADWHVKNGGNTRDPRRALRIYYCWDEGTQSVVVADMPAHRTNEVS